ncbi:MAG: HAMP domain-containing histidine kinase [Ruminococcus sp.]|nr:HAMP domain-containing histidine kinase [Ruminococcus sp.]
MLKKLRIKIVFAAMLSLFIVLAIIVCAISFFNYRNIVSDADETLAILVDNDGSFPVSDMGNPANDKESPKKNNDPGSLELPYESRYFSVFFTADGNVASTNTIKIAAVDTDSAIDYAREVLDSGKEEGFKDDYRYIVYRSDDETHIIFLDCGRKLSSLYSFILTAVGVSAAGLIAVMLLLIFLSGRIVKPFAQNYEKQKRFITDAGHELKTPLTIIDADAQILQMDFGDSEWLSDIQNQTGRLAELTNNLILLSRAEEAQTDEEMIEFPLSDVAEEIAESFKAPAKAHGKILDVQIQPMISMVGDERAIRRLITILMDNANKYSNDNGKITITLEKQKNIIRLSVFNTAEFVSKESLPHLFDRFYRADESRNSQTGGHGLGLSIASAIVATHKGKISASTQDEKSLLITVSFTA